MRPPAHVLIGGFALLTLTLAGAAAARLAGLTAGEGVYLAVLALAAAASIAARRGRSRR
jgi:hypothetical protein